VSHFHWHRGFEADREECERLSSLPHPYPVFRVFPYFVGAESGKAVFNLYKERAQSSFYEPGKRFREVFCGRHFAVEERATVDITSLDMVYSKEAMALPDFLKIDTQGSELGILQGAKTVLKSACLVEAEVEFVEIYEGQPLFHDVARFMAQNGFELLYLNRVFGLRNQVYTKKKQSRGQIVWGDALFGRREDRLGALSTNQLIKYVLLLINYGHLDFAFHLTRMHPKINETLPTLSRYFKRKEFWSKLRYKLFSQIDKLCILWLHLRKHNSLDQDSDRGWPFR